MPNYDYTCDQGHTFEATRSIAERRDPIECPECGGPAELQPQAPNWAFKTGHAPGDDPRLRPDVHPQDAARMGG